MASVEGFGFIAPVTRFQGVFVMSLLKFMKCFGCAVDGNKHNLTKSPKSFKYLLDKLNGIKSIYI